MRLPAWDFGSDTFKPPPHRCGRSAPRLAGLPALFIRQLPGSGQPCCQVTRCSCRRTVIVPSVPPLAGRVTSSQWAQDFASAEPNRECQCPAGSVPRSLRRAEQSSHLVEGVGHDLL